MKQYIITVIVLLLLLYQVALAGEDEFVKVGTTAAQFLKVEVGARALAMGGCFGAVANDASALYWNPAGISQLNNIEVTLTQTRWIADITHGFAGVVFPFGSSSSFGLSAMYQTMDEIEQTTIAQPKGTGLFFGAQDFALGLSYARAMTDFISVGITGKMIYQKIWNESATGVALDIGIMLDTGIKGIKLAMVMTNFGMDMKMDGRDLIRGYSQVPDSKSAPDTEAKLSTESWPLPTNLRLSIAMDIIGGTDPILQSEKSRVSALIDVTHPNDNPEHYNLGMEYGFNNQFFGRVGFRGNTDEEGLTAGGGVYLPIFGNVKLMLDYAYADFGLFNSVQHFTIGLKF